MKLKFIFFIILIFSFKANATRYYVNSGASGNGSGMTWSNAFTSLQEALSVVISGDEIWVAAGQYKPTTTTSRTVSFVIRDGVSMYGGFAGTETSLSQRIIGDNPTTLNGDIGQTGEITDNALSVIRASNLTTNVVLDGFRIINGYGGTNGRGAGINIQDSLTGSLTLKNCLIFNNKLTNYGGGCFIDNSKVTFDNCEFTGNVAYPGEGGAIYVYGDGDSAGSIISIISSKFIGNTAQQGTCIANNDFDYQSLNIDRSIFTNNFGETNIFEINYCNNTSIYNSLITGNTVNGSSAEILHVKSSSSQPNSDFTMVNCTVAHNFNLSTQSLQQEMIFLAKPSYKIRNCIIYGNSPYQGRQVNTGRTVSNSLIEGGYSTGTNILNLNPQFVNPNNTATTNFDAAAYNYTLAVNSPAINVGNNSFINSDYNLDLNNAARIQALTVDLGCYETDGSMANLQLGNPSKDEIIYSYKNSELIFLNFEKYKNTLIEIYTLDGKLFRTLSVTENNEKLNLKTGIYILRFRENKYLKIIVQ